MNKQSCKDFYTQLRKIKSNIICLTEREVFNFMGRVTKVFLSTQAIFADGSFLGLAGSQSICSSAQLFSVPVFLLSPSYFFTPLMTFNQRTLCPSLAPQLAIKNDVELREKTQIMIPLHDVVPSSMVTMVVSEYGVDSPCLLYTSPSPRDLSTSRMPSSA